MEQADLILTLDGEVTLDDFAKAMQRFKEIVTGLKNEVAPDARIDWLIDDLRKKCAIAKVKGVPATDRDRASVGRIRDAYTDLGQRAAKGEPLHNAEAVVQGIAGLKRLINGHVKSVTLGSEQKRYTIKKTTMFSPAKVQWDTETFGGARGKVQSISDRQYLHFTLYDYNDDRPIPCSYPEGSKDKMRKVWGKLVYVEGIVTRDPDTDLVSSIHGISSIEVIRERKAHAWRAALGCAR